MSDPPIIVVFGARLAHGTDVTLSSRQALLRSAAGRRSEKTSADPVYDSASRYVGLFVLVYFALFVTPMQRAKTSASIAHRCTMVKLHARSFVDLIV
jgi:hypothetical protein